jgi:hypothetical protein
VISQGDTHETLVTSVTINIDVGDTSCQGLCEFYHVFLKKQVTGRDQRGEMSGKSFDVSCEISDNEIALRFDLTIILSNNHITDGRL